MPGTLFFLLHFKTYQYRQDDGRVKKDHQFYFELGQAEPSVVGGVGRPVPVAISRTDIPAVVDPTAAPQHPVRAL